MVVRNQGVQRRKRTVSCQLYQTHLKASPVSAGRWRSQAQSATQTLSVGRSRATTPRDTHKQTHPILLTREKGERSSHCRRRPEQFFGIRLTQDKRRLAILIIACYFLPSSSFSSSLSLLTPRMLLAGRRENQTQSKPILFPKSRSVL